MANFRKILLVIHQKTSKNAQSEMADKHDKAEACKILRETMDEVQRIERRSVTVTQRDTLVTALDDGISRLLLGQEYCIGVLKGCPRYQATIKILNAAVKPQSSSPDEALITPTVIFGEGPTQALDDPIFSAELSRATKEQFTL